MAWLRQPWARNSSGPCAVDWNHNSTFSLAVGDSEELWRTPGEDDSAYERQGDARRKFWIKPLQETDPGVAQAFLTPKRDYVIENTDNTHIFIFFHMQP